MNTLQKVGNAEDLQTLDEFEAFGLRLVIFRIRRRLNNSLTFECGIVGSKDRTKNKVTITVPKGVSLDFFVQ